MKSQSSHNYIVTELGKRVKKIRREKGFTQEFVAEKMGISQSAYSKIENDIGSCTFNTLKKIADILQVSMPYLCDVHNELANKVKKHL